MIVSIWLTIRMVNVNHHRDLQWRGEMHIKSTLVLHQIIIHNWVMSTVYVLLFLGRTQKIHHKWFSIADAFGVHFDHFIFFLHPLAGCTSSGHAIGWKTMSKCGSLRGWRKKIKWSMCVCLGKSPLVNFLSSSEKKKLHIMYVRMHLAQNLIGCIFI